METGVMEDRREGWFDPLTGEPCELKGIIDRILSRTTYTVHVGTDTHRAKPKDSGGLTGYVFATVICLYEPGKGADYYCRRFFREGEYESLRQRITDEVAQSVDVSLLLMEHIPTHQISVHADINSDARHKTHTYLQGVKAWIQSIGFQFLCKPHAWASTGVADKHAK